MGALLMALEQIRMSVSVSDSIEMPVSVVQI